MPERSRRSVPTVKSVTCAGAQGSWPQRNTSAPPPPVSRAAPWLATRVSSPDPPVSVAGVVLAVITWPPLEGGGGGETGGGLTGGGLTGGGETGGGLVGGGLVGGGGGEVPPVPRWSLNGSCST